VRRRDLAATLGAALGTIALAPAARAAEAAKVVGILAPAPLRPIDSFKARLAERGWSEGRNIRFEPRWAGGDDNRYDALAAELAALPADAILTWSTPAVLAAKRVTAAIPIVMGAVADPVGVGAVANLSRPGGNVTGFSTQNYELEAKRLELLREFVPRMKRVAFIAKSANPYATTALRQLQAMAERAGLASDAVVLDMPAALESGLSRLTRTHTDAVLVVAAPALFPYRDAIVDFMARHQLPAIYPFREFAEVGGLIAYSTNFDDLFRQAADYVDKILRGAKPGELPVQQAATFELVINQKTAAALGLAIPPVLLARADEVIE
jgi:putative tryptophan/tyrosine transport system substrate-binding protein